MITVNRHGAVLAASDASGEAVALSDDIDDETIKTNADQFGEVAANNQRQQWARIAILDHRAQERQAKAAADKREAGIQDLLDEAGHDFSFMQEMGSERAEAAWLVAETLYDAGHRAKSTAPPVPAAPRPFQVGDVVRISDDATTNVTGYGAEPSIGRGKAGRVVYPQVDDRVHVVDLTGSTTYLPAARFLTLVTPAATS